MCNFMSPEGIAAQARNALDTFLAGAAAIEPCLWRLLLALLSARLWRGKTSWRCTAVGGNRHTECRLRKTWSYPRAAFIPFLFPTRDFVLLQRSTVFPAQGNAQGTSAGRKFALGPTGQQFAMPSNRLRQP